MNLTGMTAEDAEEKRRIEYAIVKAIESGIECQIQSYVPKSELDKKDELIRKLIEEIELHMGIDFESWSKRGDVELSDEDIQELLRIKNKQ